MAGYSFIHFFYIYPSVNHELNSVTPKQKRYFVNHGNNSQMFLHDSLRTTACHSFSHLVLSHSTRNWPKNSSWETLHNATILGECKASLLPPMYSPWRIDFVPTGTCYNLDCPNPPTHLKSKQLWTCANTTSDNVPSNMHGVGKPWNYVNPVTKISIVGKLLHPLNLHN